MSRSKPRARLDDLLVERGEFSDRAAVERAVIAGEVLVDDVVVASAAVRVATDAEVVVRGRARFVSRGGEKLAGALEAFDVDVTGLRCIDVGASTGGFTDCLLQAGAREVCAVDVGYGQFAWKLRQDGRVRLFERTNIRLADPVELGAPFDLIAADLSFIGLARLSPVFAALGALGTRFVGLVKPQFEAAADETDHGVVRKTAVHARVVGEVATALAAVGFDVVDTCASPLLGPAGNREFFVYARLAQSIVTKECSIS